MTAPGPCAEARATLQDLLDGPVTSERRASLDRHLSGCPECREVRAGLESVRAALRALPELPLPDDALNEVWDRTVRTPTKDVPSRTWWKPAVALAASVLLTALVVIWSGRIEPVPVPPAAGETYTDEEIERARAELRQVMAITAGAFDRSRHAVLERVIEGEVVPAIRRIPIHWPESGPGDSRRSKT